MDPIPPAHHHAPLKVAEDTYLIRHLQGEGQGPMAVYINSLVIQGKEPIIVDTGGASNREQWVRDVFGLVDPEAVRWIFLSHDDHDHTGNLRLTLEMCPNATLITNWFTVERLAVDLALPLNRMKWVEDGQSFEANGRTYGAIRPPVYDSPTTRGLYDPKTGVYWASDAFATPVPAAVDHVSELDANFWREGFLMFQRAVAPWHGMLDQAKFDREIARLESLDITTIVTGHGPVLSGAQIKPAFTMTHELPSLDAVVLPGQAELDAIVAMTMEPVTEDEEDPAA